MAIKTKVKTKKNKTPKILFIESPYGNSLFNSELFGYKSLDEVRTSWLQHSVAEELEGGEVYEVQVLRKLKAKNNGISFEEVK